ncbi:hypothetical protein [Streptomyces fradiae]|uniref:hypothetical protein n=2 Tax=Streptomyces fradiae TaxID=1906 RepID=UPI002942B872|nr:hypothetical protein [Streptomyces fradiae]WOI59952.1 hypothetical protein RYQ63_08580 [Streptomyces fradiae]
MSGNPVLVQSRFGRKGNFELLVPAGAAGLHFLWRNNDASGLPWSAPFTFAQNVGRVDAITMIQSNFGSPGNLELIARSGDRLNFFWRDSGPAFRWNGPFQIASGASGNPVLVQSRFGGKGNFELLYPSAAGGITFMWRNNDASGLPWSAPFTFAQNVGRVDAITMIQSNFGSPGNLELIARSGDRLNFFWRDSGPAFRWNGPFQIASGASGNPVLVQSRFGGKGNFELLYPSAAGGITFMWRNNDASGLPWSAPFTFAQNVGRVDAITMIQSNFGSPGNLELIARSGDRLNFFWRDSGPAFRWNGPSRMVVGSASLRAIQTASGRFIHIDGTGFSENSSVKIAYDIFTNGGPTTHQTGERSDSTDAGGSFTEDIKVNLSSVSGVRVNVTDDRTHMRAEAAL